MALFGAPITNENDIDRTIRTALEMQDISRKGLLTPLILLIPDTG